MGEAEGLVEMHLRQRSVISLGLLVMALLFTVFFYPTAAMAGEIPQDKVRIGVQPGLSGLYKVGFPTGLNITVYNQDQDLKGLLIVSPENNERDLIGPTLTTRFQRSIEIPAGSMVKTNLMVPGDLVNSNSVIQLVVDGKVVASTPIQGTAVNGGLIALSLGERPLRGGIAAWLDQTFGGQTAIKYLAPNYLPEDTIELTLADIIIVDEQAVSQITPKQVELLKDWVSLGGLLIISGGAGTGAGGPLADISPVIAEEQKIISADLGGLRMVTGTMQVTTGKVVQGEVTSKVNGVVVVASRSIGKGRVIYSGISLENLTSESAAVWPVVFGQKNGPGMVDVKMALNGRHLGNDMLGHVAGYLPQLKTPPVPQVALAWFVYVIVVGPVLYFVLKRYDRRDWLWWIIPACALVTTTVVYFMSPAQRINAPISHTLAVVEILNPTMAEINATAAFISPMGGHLMSRDPPARWYGLGRPIIITQKNHQLSNTIRQMDLESLFPRWNIGLCDRPGPLP
nr:hypothetical protein [Desulforamulus aquiferis]